MALVSVLEYLEFIAENGGSKWNEHVTTSENVPVDISPLVALMAKKVGLSNIWDGGSPNANSISQMVSFLSFGLNK